MKDNLSFGYWLRRRRKSLDLTQVELGRRVGASAAMIRKIEADERRPSLALAELLAAELAVSTEDRQAFLHAARGISLVAMPPISSNPLSPPSHNLPAPVTSLVNRQTALSEVKALLLRDDMRLLTLVGPPGIGKTRLSIQAARDSLQYFADGAWFVDLSAATSPAHLLPAIALAMNVALAPGLTPAQSVTAALGNKRLLLVLDNLEQIVEEAGQEIANLLRHCSRLKVLATSRLRLNVYGEFEYQLPAMTLPPQADTYDPGDLLAYESVQLFVDRARQHQRDFAPTSESAASVATICRQMEGVPLALEIAAARTRYMPVDELARALRAASGRDWHHILRTTASDLPQRQRTLFHTVAWSYSLLDAPEQQVLRRLAVFEGNFDAAAAADVCYAGEEDGLQQIVATLQTLTDHSLVSLESRSPQRWRLLIMIREFARSQLTESEKELARLRHARHFARRIGERLYDWSDTEMFAAIDRDLDNYRAATYAALEMQDAPIAYRLGAVLGVYAEVRGLYQEGRPLLQHILTLTGEVGPSLRLEVLHRASTMAWMQNDFAAAEAWALEAMSLAQSEALPQHQTTFLNLLGRIYLEQARYDAASQVLRESITLSRRLSSPDASGLEIIQLGEVALAQCKLDEAEILTREGLGEAKEQDLIPFAVGWNNMAEIALARGDAPAARDALEHLLHLADIHGRRARFFLLSVAGLLLLAQDNPERDTITAVRLLSALGAANERLGDPLSPLAQFLIEVRIEVSRGMLPEGVWQAAWTDGHGWSLEQALEAVKLLL